MEKKNEERVSIPLRIPNSLYKQLRFLVNQKKDIERGYSINKFVNEAIEEKLSKRSRSVNNGK